jgi:hypothetical protein
MSRYAKVLTITLALAGILLLVGYLLDEGVRVSEPVGTQEQTDRPYTFFYVEELNDRVLRAMPLLSPTPSAAWFDPESHRLHVEVPGFTLPAGARGVVLHETRNNDILLASNLMLVHDAPVTLKDEPLHIMAEDLLTEPRPMDIVDNSRRLLRGDIQLIFLDDGRVRVTRGGEERLLAPGEHWLLEEGKPPEPRSRLLLYHAGTWSTRSMTIAGR